MNTVCPFCEAQFYHMHKLGICPTCSRYLKPEMYGKTENMYGKLCEDASRRKRSELAAKEIESKMEGIREWIKSI